MNTAFLRRRKPGTIALSTALAAALLVPGLLRAASLVWDAGAAGNGTSWTANTGANWNPNQLPTPADDLLLNNTAAVPTSMTIATNDIGALSVTFANNFNASNTALIGDGGTGNRLFTLGSTGNAWTITNAATSGSVTFAPSNGNTGILSFTMASNGTMNVATGGSSVFTTAIAATGAFGMNKTGGGNLTLGGLNTYSGGTTISAGGLFASANGALGSGAVNVALTGTLTLTATTTNAIADGATLTLDGVLGLAGAAGASQETVGSLVIGGVARAPGTYGASGSGAANIDNAHFSGTGVLTVVPEPGVNALLAAAAGALGLIARRRRSARR